MSKVLSKLLTVLFCGCLDTVEKNEPPVVVTKNDVELQLVFSGVFSPKNNPDEFQFRSDDEERVTALFERCSNITVSSAEELETQKYSAVCSVRENSKDRFASFDNCEASSVDSEVIFSGQFRPMWWFDYKETHESALESFLHNSKERISFTSNSSLQRANKYQQDIILNYLKNNSDTMKDSIGMWEQFCQDHKVCEDPIRAKLSTPRLYLDKH